MLDGIGFIFWQQAEQQQHRVFIPQQAYDEVCALENINAFTDVRQWWLIIPSRDCLATSVKLPKNLPKSKQRIAAINLAEELLLNAVDDNHYALATANSQHELPLIIVQKKLLDDILRQCRQANLMINHIYPDYFLLPTPTENSWHVYFTAEEFIIRINDYLGFAGPRAHYEIFKQQYLADHNLERPEIIRYDDQTFSELITKNLSQTPPINVCQGEYQLQTTDQSPLTLWRWLKIALISCLVITCSSKLLQVGLLNHKIKHQQQAIAKIYYKLFPHATSLISPRLRVERLLHSQTSTNPNRFLFSNVDKLYSLLPTSKEIMVQELSYQAQGLQVKLHMKNMSTAENLLKALKQTHIEIKQQITSNAQGIIMSLTIIGNSHG